VICITLITFITFITPFICASPEASIARACRSPSQRDDSTQKAAEPLLACLA
jgi:hypothetical protein